MSLLGVGPRFAICTLFIACCVASQAAAQAADESALAAARALGRDGVTLYQSGQYAQALDKLERAYAVARVPSLGLWAGRALEKLGRLVEASQRYREVTLIPLTGTESDVLRKAQAD